jgi:hypothetical protein
MQNVHDIFERITLQPIFALAPAQADFLSFQPDSPFTPATLPTRPWTLHQLENCLAVHISHVATYISLLSMEAANICTGRDVRAAFGLEEDADDNVAASLVDAHRVPPPLADILIRASFNLKCGLRTMLLVSASAFAAHLQLFLGQPWAGPVRGSNVEVRSHVIGQNTARVLFLPSPHFKSRSTGSFLRGASFDEGHPCRPVSLLLTAFLSL